MIYLNKFIKTSKRDKIKNSLIFESKGVAHFIRISYMDDLSPNNIKDKIIAAGVKC